MSQRDDLFGLLASVLYQRYSFGLKVPVVGLTYNPVHPTLQLVIAWLEECDTSDGRLPPVHVAVGGSSNHPASLGLFNLCDPISILRLSAFLLSIRDQAEHLRGLVLRTPDSMPLVPLIWQSDFNQEEDSGGSFQSKIITWLRGVPETFHVPAD
ncbi:hypothetical protein OE88DRAFT_1739444 [Heliocybe sulcata]|uniref:Uncharacterized protein n=1 Tax=Heliocybe sulcata TaxID=5364 RepID=A0A5C3MM03_9AGAM|nr:hypothetical protein OE88DRAFT_1739444 [Heliocybe sulcata]